MSKKTAHPHQGIADAIRRVSHAIYQDDEENRDHLRTVRLEVSADRAIALATDGHRISCASSALPPPPFRGDFPVGKYTIACKPKEAAKIKPAGVAGFVDDSGLQFPDWRNAIPARFDYSATVKREELLAAVDACERTIGRIEEIERAKHACGKLALKAEDNRLRRVMVVGALKGTSDATMDRTRKDLEVVTAKIANYDDSTDNILRAVRFGFGPFLAFATATYSETIDGDLFKVEVTGASLNATVRGECRDTIGIDVRYLAEAVRATTGETITIEAIDNYSPIRISDSDGWELIMPMRLR